MKINPDSSIQLDEDELFLEERRDPDNIWRTITLWMPTGAHVKVQRHFSQIGPIVIRPDGTKIDTQVVDGVVVDRDNWSV